MKINENSKIKEIEIILKGAKDIRKKVLIGPDDGSRNIIMRYFTILRFAQLPTANIIGSIGRLV